MIRARTLMPVLALWIVATAHAQGTTSAPSSPSAAPEGPGINYPKIELKTEKLAPHFYTLTGSENADPNHPEGAGGRIGLLEGPDGIAMVDAQYGPLNDKVLAAIKSISTANIRFLIDTHSHGDHTGGNAGIGRLGALDHRTTGDARRPGSTANQCGSTYRSCRTAHPHGRVGSAGQDLPGPRGDRSHSIACGAYQRGFDRAV